MEVSGLFLAIYLDTPHVFLTFFIKKMKNIWMKLFFEYLCPEILIFIQTTIKKSTKMKKTKILLSGLILSVSLLKAQDTTKVAATGNDDSNFSITTTLNSDIFFGFYPFVTGSYSFNEKSALSFYSIMWSGGTGAAWGNWTEFGIGYSYTPVEGLTINPQVGLLNGSLTSGLGTPVLGEGIVPNLTVGFDFDKFEGEIYGGYYLGFDHANPNTNTYLHYWLNGGYKASSLFSFGLHFEHLRFMGGQGYASDAAYDYYKSFGPYIQFAGNNSFMRFTAGADLRSDAEVTKSAFNQPSFFKLTVGHSF